MPPYLLRTGPFLLPLMQHPRQQIPHITSCPPVRGPAPDNVLGRVERVELLNEEVENLPETPQVQGPAAVPLAGEVLGRELLLRPAQLGEVFRLVN